MTLQELEQSRDAVKKQYADHLAKPTAPGADVQKHLQAIELLASIRVLDQLVAMEKASLAKPPGALGPALVGV